MWFLHAYGWLLISYDDRFGWIVLLWVLLILVCLCCVMIAGFRSWVNAVGWAFCWLVCCVSLGVCVRLVFFAGCLLCRVLCGLVVCASCAGLLLVWGVLCDAC